MNDAISKITLDLQQSSTPVTVSVKRRDTGRRIMILLSDGGFEYEIAPDCYAVLTATKPDGNILYNHCSIDNNEISYEITEQTTAVAGRMKAEIKLYGADDHLVTSATFRIIVDGTVYDDNRVQSEDEISALTHLVSEAAGVIYEGNQMIGEGQQAIQNATAAVEMANQILDHANSAVDAAVTATNAADQAALTANAASGRADTSAQNADNATNRANTATQNAESVITKATKAAESATGAAQNANQAAAAANTAAQNVTSAKDQAVTAANAANSAASSAETAARNANVAINNASTATDRANTSAYNAENATGSAIAAAKSAADASASAGAAATEAVSAAQMARTASAAANTSASNANTASDSATAAAQKANTAAVNAENAMEEIQKVTLDIAPIVSSATGEVVSLDDSYNRPIRGLKIYGKTTQNGTPSPDAPVPLVSAGDGGSIGVTVSGKNLIDFAKIIQGYELTNGEGQMKVNAEWYVTEWIQVQPSTTYVLSGTSSGYRAEVNENYEGDNKGRSETVFTTKADTKYVKFNSKIDGYSTPQLEVGSTATAYEPYKEQQTLTISTPTGLPGIPVSSGGNYTDSTGQQWVCDEMDFDRGVYVQRIGKSTLDKTNKWNWNTARSCIRTEVPGGVTDTNIQGARFAISNKYAGTSWEALGTGSGDGYCCSMYYSLSAIAFFDKDCTSSGDFLAKLGDNSIEVQYILATPIETPLSDIDLSALHTHYPNTTVFNDGGAGMEVKYVADTKRYIDKKFDQLAAAIVNNV